MNITLARIDDRLIHAVRSPPSGRRWRMPNGLLSVMTTFITMKYVAHYYVRLPAGNESERR